ncbi:MAG TPA: GntR family transcriptional regulator [Gemmatimonadales bacterium]|nr:GntR family transcriptional regulator [Gemmatimonadales bacterium]
MTQAEGRPERRSEAAARVAYGRLREAIVRGRLRPGARVTEAEAAERLGVSRTPVREALDRLQREGLLVPDGGGARPRLAVAPLAAEAVADLYQAAGALEGVAARRVAELSAAARRELAEALRAADAAFRVEADAAAPDLDRLFDLHAAFHETLMAACAGPPIRALLETLRPQLDRYEWAYAPAMERAFAPTYAEHAAITRAAGAGDANAAEAAVRANWFNGGARLARALARGQAGRIAGAPGTGGAGASGAASGGRPRRRSMR